MSRPSDVLSKISTPQSHFPEFALSSRDFRLNFCINNGSESMLKIVPVYTPRELDSQLDIVSI